MVTNMTNMTTDFFDRTHYQDQIVEALYDRLDAVRNALAVRVDRDDEFELGINCRLANEEFWLTNLLDTVERSR
jgi:hypothetical protein